MSADEKKLLEFFRQLGESERDSLLAFGEFLVSRSQPPNLEPQPLPEPRHVPRPETESVVGAIKRLNAVYHMLEDKSGLLNETSVLMTQHVMQGRPAGEVIDDLEAVFARFYNDWQAGQGK